jgi:hypothetical protein
LKSATVRLKGKKGEKEILKKEAWSSHRDHIGIQNRSHILYITADIHSMGPFGLILAPQPYNKLER